MAASKSSKNRAERKPYEKRTDIQKIRSQWTKLSGLHDRTDWSAAIVRAATATEIAVNFAIRKEFTSRSRFDEPFVNGLLRWANGLPGKLDRLLIPLLRGRKKLKTITELRPLAQKIHDKRNDIAHRGEFCSEGVSAALIDDCQKFVHGVVRLYKPTFTLADRNEATVTAAAGHEKRSAKKGLRK